MASQEWLAVFCRFMEKKLNINKPGYGLKFGYKSKRVNQVSRYCSDIIVFRG